MELLGKILYFSFELMNVQWFIKNAYIALILIGFEDAFNIFTLICNYEQREFFCLLIVGKRFYQRFQSQF